MGLMSRLQTRRQHVISTKRRETAFEDQRGTSQRDEKAIKKDLKITIARVSELEGGGTNSVLA